MKTASEQTNRRFTALLICLMLGLAVWGVFGQTRRYDFVNYDDDLYVYDNPVVSNGLNPRGVADAFTPSRMGLFYPLTMLSLMTDAELHGLDAGGFHLTNVLLHATTVLLLFLVLHSMTGSLWRSAFVSAVFAIHPLRVESVAWITERKDVLSGLFFALTLAAYVRYVRRPFSVFHYMPVLVFFALGLLSKPSLTPLPFGLLLLDGWPLGRFPNGPAAAVPSYPASLRRVLAEKVPLVALSFLMSALTVYSHSQAVVSPAQRELSVNPLPWNLWNAAVSYATYIGQSLWPFRLAVHYPYSGGDLSVWAIVLSLTLLGGVSLAVLKAGKDRPYLMVGWLWYLGMLLPMIGIVRTLGGVAHADRFTYLPQIGLVIMVTWLIADCCASLRYRHALLSAAAATVLSVLAVTAHGQARHWRDSISLWTHALAHTENNAVAHNNLGLVLAEQGRTEAAIQHYQQALRVNPRHAAACNNLGNALAAQGKTAEAIDHYQQALQIDPHYADAYNNLGVALAAQGKTAAAVELFQQALRINEGSQEISENLQKALLEMVRLGTESASQGRFGEAIRWYEQIIGSWPEHAAVKNNLAWVLATCPEAALRDGPRAVELATAADRATGGTNASVLDTLAAAYAEAGRYPEAVATARRALDAAAGEESSAEGIRLRLRLYEEGIPYRESAD